MLEIDTKKVEEIIRHVAATEIAPRFNNLKTGDVREKKPGDFVTVADEASERELSRLLTDILPNSIVVGEETVAKDKSVLARFASDKPIWVIDPIDGTYNYSHGIKKFGVLLALVQNNQTIYGWSFDIPQNKMAVASKGAGTFLDGKRILIDNNNRLLSDMIINAGGARPEHFNSVRGIFKNVANNRCSLYDYMEFIGGKADAVIHIGTITSWDHAANNLLASEVGAYVALDDGIPYNPAEHRRAFSIVAPNKNMWKEIRAATYEKLKR